MNFSPNRHTRISVNDILERPDIVPFRTAAQQAAPHAMPTTNSSSKAVDDMQRGFARCSVHRAGRDCTEEIACLNAEIKRLNLVIFEISSTKERLSTENSKYMTQIAAMRQELNTEKNHLEDQLRATKL